MSLNFDEDFADGGDNLGFVGSSSNIQKQNFKSGGTPQNSGFNDFNEI